MNNQQVASGTVSSLAVGAATTVSLPSTWTNTPTNITLVADPTNQIAEGSEANNSRTIRNNALMVGLWAEQTIYNFFDEHQLDSLAALGATDGANSWEDWAVRQMDRWNQSLSSAVFAQSAPQGGLDRVHLDEVTVVPDGALPLLHFGPPTNYPNLDDHTVDMMWGFPSTLLTDMSFYNPVDPNLAFNLEPSLVHELNHARFLIDSYIQDVSNAQIDVLDNAGNRLFPNDSNPAYLASTGASMMHSTTYDYAEWEISWLNVYARQRALPGWANFNAHFGLDGYMQTTPRKFPTQNTLKILGANGQPLSGARVRVYQPVGSEEGKTFDNVPELDVTTGAPGTVALGSQPFSLPNDQLFGGACSLGVNFVRVTKNGQESFGWLDLAQVQVQYFRGQTGSVTYNVPTSL